MTNTNKHPKHQYKKKTSGNSKPKKFSQVKLQTFNPRTLFFPTFGSSSAAQSSVWSFLESEGIQRWKSPLCCIGLNDNTYDLCLYRLLLLFCWWNSSGFFSTHGQPQAIDPSTPSPTWLGATAKVTLVPMAEKKPPWLEYEKQLWCCWILVQIINEKRFIDKHRERERASPVEIMHSGIEM